MTHFPIFLDLTARRCVVVGGGAVAARKVDALLAAGADVTVVAPALTARLALRAADRRVQWVPREYRAGDLENADLAFATTDDERVNEAVARDGRAQRVWVNAADDPGRCDFHLPAVVRRGALTVAVGTAGTSPALARVVREELEDFLTADHAALAEVAADVRRELRAGNLSPDGDAWAAALRRADVRRLIAAGHLDEAREALRVALAHGARSSEAPAEALPDTLRRPTVDGADPASEGPAATGEHTARLFVERPPTPPAPTTPPGPMTPATAPPPPAPMRRATAPPPPPVRTRTNVAREGWPHP
ncbi:MAG: bifunctional precorrin-2 dehydrogenase/sirohydrochlorin ferrochelatase [Candidatus Rokubacteria bacterium]|nr:bifunctional precorrin-2 dehydrogenase/sirohydrochlorin ferrochelatase [Candidatus Rokubacteria bacterium]